MRRKKKVEDPFDGMFDSAVDPFDGLVSLPAPTITVEPKRDVFGDLIGGVEPKKPKMPMWPI